MCRIDSVVFLVEFYVYLSTFFLEKFNCVYFSYVLNVFEVNCMLVFQIVISGLKFLVLPSFDNLIIVNATILISCFSIGEQLLLIALLNLRESFKIVKQFQIPFTCIR